MQSEEEKGELCCSWFQKHNDSLSYFKLRAANINVFDEQYCGYNYEYFDTSICNDSLFVPWNFFVNRPVWLTGVYGPHLYHGYLIKRDSFIVIYNNTFLIPIQTVFLDYSSAFSSTPSYFCVNRKYTESTSPWGAGYSRLEETFNDSNYGKVWVHRFNIDGGKYPELRIYSNLEYGILGSQIVSDTGRNTIIHHCKGYRCSGLVGGSDH